MKRVIKEIPAADGELQVVSAGRRQSLAHFQGRVEICEYTTTIPVLGAVQKGTKQIYASFIVCGMEYHREIDDGFIHSGKVYEAAANVQGKRLHFAGMRFADSNPVSNELVFCIPDLELIQALLGE